MKLIRPDEQGKKNALGSAGSIFHTYEYRPAPGAKPHGNWEP